MPLRIHPLEVVSRIDLVSGQCSHLVALVLVQEWTGVDLELAGVRYGADVRRLHDRLPRHRDRADGQRVVRNRNHRAGLLPGHAHLLHGVIHDLLAIRVAAVLAAVESQHERRQRGQLGVEQTRRALELPV